MRTLVPAETLVYLETNDLAAALQPIVDAKPFKEVAKSQPDLSALKGVQLAVAVLGFEATEEKLTDEQSVGNVKPRFVAVADTHAWNSTAVAFAERKLGGFVAEIYGSEPKLEKSDKHGGKYFAWTAEDKRKAYALVIDGIVYFANDETAIDKCIAVRRGEADSILKTEKIKPPEPGTLARGYVSTDGIAQISGVIGMKLASEASDESEIQSAVADILPQLIRNSATSVSWAATSKNDKIQDLYSVTLRPDLARTLKETLGSGSDFQVTDFEELIPNRSALITRYLITDPLLGWRSLTVASGKLVEPRYSAILPIMSASLFDAYSIDDPEMFLGSVIDRRILTAQLDQNGDEIVAITKTKNLDQLKRSLSKDIDFSKPGEPSDDAILWRSADGSTTIAVLKTKILKDDTALVDLVIFGDTKGVEKCLVAKTSGSNFTQRDRYKEFEINNATSITISNELGPDANIVNLFSEAKGDASPSLQTSFTATSFDQVGLQRVTLSDFGLIGQIIAQLAGED